MSEKPLHVQVAEALGWAPVELREDLSPPYGLGCPCHSDWVGWRNTASRPLGVPLHEVPRYDTDWSATGPLIERLKISLEAHWSGPKWRAYAGDRPNGAAFGETPLIAVCNLILALQAAGKLPKP